MAKRSSSSHEQYGIDYTITGLVVIVGIVVVTALFFAQPNVAVGAGNIAGQAYAPAGIADTLTPDTCEQASFCDGSRLVRQGADCQQYEAFCTYGCSYENGHARCNS